VQAKQWVKRIHGKEDRVQRRANDLLSEEKRAGSDNPLRQAEVILQESDQRQENRLDNPTGGLEHRRSEDTTPPAD
jgi:hypothetical protein